MQFQAVKTTIPARFRPDSGQEKFSYKGTQVHKEVQGKKEEEKKIQGDCEARTTL
jgi:hypothetical protein